jgi:hypothetical protein
VQLIVVEFSQYFMLEVLQQVGREQSASLPGVHETIQLVDQHRAMVLELGYDRLVQGVELPRIHHVDQSTCGRRLIPAHNCAALGSKGPSGGLVVVVKSRATVEFGG